MGCRANEELNRFMLDFGFSAKHMGFVFLRECLKIVVKEGHLYSFLTKHIYPAIAEKYQTSVQCVERNIRSAIERAWESSTSDKLNIIFGNIKKRPTNREIIAILGDKAIVLFSA